MKNTGNSCYLNAILQALVGLPTFVVDLSSLRQEAILRDKYETTKYSATKPQDSKKVKKSVLKILNLRL
jgi:uncharacterized UBP type Zn finger protein